MSRFRKTCLAKGRLPTAGRQRAVLRTDTPKGFVLPFQPPCRLSPTLPPGGRQPTEISNLSTDCSQREVPRLTLTFCSDRNRNRQGVCAGRRSVSQKIAYFNVKTPHELLHTHRHRQNTKWLAFLHAGEYNKKRKVNQEGMTRNFHPTTGIIAIDASKILHRNARMPNECAG